MPAENSPSFSIRFTDVDKRNLNKLSELLRLRKSDVIRLLMAERINTLNDIHNGTGVISPETTQIDKEKKASLSESFAIQADAIDSKNRSL